MIYDAIIIGGSFSGLAAALQLARARRRVLVIDAGNRRNRFVEASHGFLGQDGRAPGDIVADAREQLMNYPTAEIFGGSALSAEKVEDGFAVAAGNGQTLQARRLILATGVVDQLPDIQGLRERWGKSVFHCPYCHGYELDRGRIGIVSVGELSLHQAQLLTEWGDVTFLLNGTFEPDEAQCADLIARGVTIEPTSIREITGDADVHLADGRVISFAGLFTASKTSVSSPLAEQLGCRFLSGPLGDYIETSGMMETSVPGVFACGDAARAAGSVALAVGDGTMAGVATHRSLVFT